jgi:eukaryotic-like serine/threonine-protein kinase
MKNLIGELVGERWRLESVIGRGGHSLIYKARDVRGGPDVAVKLLQEKVARDPEHAARMVREQRVLTTLSGTAVVNVYALTSGPEGALCLVMELLHGTDLDDLLCALEARGGRISVEALLSILGPVVDTLEAAHGAGIVHRDLKPGNIFVLDRAGGGGVRLLDFGLAKLAHAEPLTREGVIIGSPSYIAPEVWTGDVRTLDHRVDLYSLGAIVFRALAGRVPFDAPGIRGKLEAATSAPRPSLQALRTDLPEPLDAWIAQALAILPEQRFQSVRGMHDALLRCLGSTQLQTSSGAPIKPG